MSRPDKFSFSVKYGDDDKTVFTAKSEIEANEWVKAIKDTQADAKKAADTQKDVKTFAN